MVSSPKNVAERIARQVSSALALALPDGGEVSVAYSGGIDSTVLLGLAREHQCANVELTAVHVNHNLHPRANEWAKHCSQRCRRWGVPLTIVDVQVDKRRQGLENRARQARLAALRSVSADAILMAHHADDQAETLLLRVLRGSGVRGLSAMHVKSRLPSSGKMLVRPLLSYTKRDLRKAARHLRVRGISDPVNSDVCHNRNWLRHEVLPQATKRFPGAVTALNAAARNAQDIYSLLADLAQLDETAATTAKGDVNRGYLASLGHERVANWLAWHVAARGQNALTGKHLREATRQICDTRGDLSLKVAGSVLICDRGKLFWSDSVVSQQAIVIDKITATSNL